MDWPWLGNAITAAATLIGVGLTLYFTTRKDARISLFKRYDELSSDTRQAVADFSQALIDLGEPAMLAAEAIQTWAHPDNQRPDSAPVTAALARWNLACDAASSKGLIAQMMCPEEELSHKIASVRGALVGDECHDAPPALAFEKIEVAIRGRLRLPNVVTDLVLVGYMERMDAVIDEMNSVIDLVRLRLNDPAATQKWVARRIHERREPWAKRTRRNGSEQIEPTPT
ncbi:hypothetical protein [Gordonia jacobaea]|uniref:hypothetical protein n=1 Tax=Gordonia jacobaea TaxID=122202 RepID=UPI0022E6BD65|nr:hypothetical protein [Gordonia jacobaea]